MCRPAPFHCTHLQHRVDKGVAQARAPKARRHAKAGRHAGAAGGRDDAEGAAPGQRVGAGETAAAAGARGGTGCACGCLQPRGTAADDWLGQPAAASRCIKCCECPSPTSSRTCGTSSIKPPPQLGHTPSFCGTLNCAWPAGSDRGGGSSMGKTPRAGFSHVGRKVASQPCVPPPGLPLTAVAEDDRHGW